MAKTVVGLFDTMTEAQGVVQDLVDSGVDRNNISVVANDSRGEYKNYATGDSGTKAEEGAGAGAVGGTVAGGVLGLLVGIGALAIPGIGPVLAAGPLAAAVGTTAAAAGSAALGAGIGAAAGGLIGGLAGAGIPEQDAQLYAEGVRRGGALVLAKTDDSVADRAYDVMQRHGAIDIDARSAQWREGGWSKFDANAKPYTSNDIDTFRTQYRSAPTTTVKTNVAPAAASTTTKRTNTGDTVLPVVEEELQVGKREVQRGGVRVFTHVTETPVEEQVKLREEHVNVERRPVNRDVTDADMANFKEASFEVTETAEEAVVSKRARVVEEVVVGKEVRERTETVRDSVRRTDVDVEQIAGETRTSGTTSTGFDTFSSDFSNNYKTNFANSGYTYDQFTPVYRYGYTLGTDKRYSSGDWKTVEPEARRQWEERNPGTWADFKDAVRYAWDRARGRNS